MRAAIVLLFLSFLGPVLSVDTTRCACRV